MSDSREQVTAFLTALALERGVSASTQAQARAALLFLYRQVLDVDLPGLDEVVSCKTQRCLPVVLTPAEVRELLHGTGMRLLEGLRLCVKDVEFTRRELVALRQGRRLAARCLRARGCGCKRTSAGGSRNGARPHPAGAVRRTHTARRGGAGGLELQIPWRDPARPRPEDPTIAPGP